MNDDSFKLFAAILIVSWLIPATWFVPIMIAFAILLLMAFAAERIAPAPPGKPRPWF